MRETDHRRRHRQPVDVLPAPKRGFRVVAAGVLLVGAVGGVALGTQYTTTATGLRLWVDPAASVASDSEADAAAKAARDKAAAAAATAAAQAKRANDVASRSQTVSQPQARSVYPVPTSCANYVSNRVSGTKGSTDNVAIACALLIDAGLGLQHMPCLDLLWSRESGWNPKATNKSSGAYGIPQALPATKLAAFGADWQTNPVPQIKWGLNYIKDRYQTPCGAWVFWQNNNWY